MVNWIHGLSCSKAGGGHELDAHCHCEAAPSSVLHTQRPRFIQPRVEPFADHTYEVDNTNMVIYQPHMLVCVFSM